MTFRIRMLTVSVCSLSLVVIPGDFFYVIDSGKFNVYKRPDAYTPSSENDGYGRQVFQYETGGSFGELALMYSVPRAATVRASTPGILWRTDRETFRHIIIDSTAVKRKNFEAFLESVPLLSNLSRQERAQVADCLETVAFKEGELIIKQGDDGDKLFLILDGKAKATQTPVGSAAEADPIEVGRMNAGQYFGERSLITREPRAANVIALTSMTCACMDRSGEIATPCDAYNPQINMRLLAR
jgi:cAMP-dependent protein kinase regulator